MNLCIDDLLARAEKPDVWILLAGDWCDIWCRARELAADASSRDQLRQRCHWLGAPPGYFAPGNTLARIAAWEMCLDDVSDAEVSIWYADYVRLLKTVNTERLAAVAAAAAEPVIAALALLGADSDVVEVARVAERRAAYLIDDRAPGRTASWMQLVAAFCRMEACRIRKTLEQAVAPRRAKAVRIELLNLAQQFDDRLSDLRAALSPEAWGLRHLRARYLTLVTNSELQRLTLGYQTPAAEAWWSLVDQFAALPAPIDAAACALLWLQSARLVARELGTEIDLDRVRRSSDLGRAALAESPAWHVAQPVQQLLAVAHIELGDLQAVPELVATGLASAVQRLADCSNDYDRSALASVAEDWLGVALELDMRSTKQPSTLYASVGVALNRPRTLAVSERNPCFTLYNHRFFSAVGLSSPTAEPRWAPIATAETLFEHLGKLQEMVCVDLERYSRGAMPDVDQAPWLDALAKLARRHGLSLGKEMAGNVEFHATRSDLPLTAMVDHVHHAVTAVLGVRHGLPEDRASHDLPAGRKIVFLCGFAKDEPIREHFRDLMISFQVNNCATWTDVGSLEEMKAALARPALGYVIGMHGDLSDVLDPTVVMLGGTRVPVPVLLSDVSLPADSFAVALVCFGGGGFRDALGGGHGMPDQFLQAGARLVVASRFPVWLCDATVDPTKRLLRSLQASVQCGELDKAAAATMYWMRELRAVRPHPREWAGMACWTRPERMKPL